mmetsp:Transcript_3577/g.10462  ORF Transcript_3577/g.10462 Transcript_3577/m.10462 type:complete len:645 (+) Transcript_3577:453-2387(+)
MPRHELVAQDAQGPPINGIGVSCGGDDLRGEVVGRPASCEGLTDHEFGQPHVRQLDVALIGEQQVLGLEVSVDDSPLMQVLEGINRAGDVVLAVPLAAVQALSVVRGIQLATQGGLKQEVQRLGAVVRLPQLDDEIGIGHHQDVLLVHHAVLHARLDDVPLAKTLHGVGFLCDLVLKELHSAEAAATQQANPDEVLAQDLVPGLVRDSRSTWAHRPLARHRGAGAALPLPLDDVLQRPQQQVEGVAVEHKGLRCVGRYLYRSAPRLVVEERAFAEVLGGRAAHAGGQVAHHGAVLLDGNLAVVEDVKGVAGLALLNDKLVAGEVHFHKGLCQLLLLLSEQRRQDGDPVQILGVLPELCVRHLHEHVLEVPAVDDPHCGVLFGLHSGSPWHKVQQCQLAEAAALGNGAHNLRVGAGDAVRLLPVRHRDVEGAGLDDIEIVCLKVSLCDDLLPSCHLLFPHDIDEALHLRIVERGNCRQVLVVPDRLRDELRLVGCLRGRRLRLGHLLSPATNGAARRELQPLMQPQFPELVALDLVGGQGGFGRYRGHPSLIPQKRVLTKVVADFQRGYLLRLAAAFVLDEYTRLTSADHEKLVSVLALLDNSCALGEVLHDTRRSDQRVLIFGQTLHERHACQELHLRLVLLVL